MWLALRFPHWALDSRTPADRAYDRDTTLIADHRDGRRIVVAAGETAERAGITRGMALADARLRLPSALVHERGIAAEQAALQRLAGWAWGYSSQVHAATGRTASDCTHLVFEIGASLRLFGGRRALLGAVRQDLSARAYRFHAGVGLSPQAALAFARASHTKRGADLAGLPLSCLDLEPRTAASLTASGLQFTGELLALPPASLARRYGPALLDYLERLRGRRPHGLALYRLPERYRTRHELIGAVETTQGLKFVLRRALNELAAVLRGADAAIQQLALTLVHDRHPPTRLCLRLARPSRQADHLERVVAERMARVKLSAPVLEVGLATDRLRRVEAHQEALWQDASASTSDDDWPAVLDRIRARLGHDAVGWLHGQADHRPERASVMRDHPPTESACIAAPRPLWLFATPRPVTGDMLEFVTDAERIETGWWQEGVRRDYFRARDTQGRLLWVYRELDRRERTAPGQYYLHGLFG
ncbi:DNA polymerase Y family protein [Salinisphaera sp. T31B1]|uniref:Y-family DNA polymerase n=1 Tax=Salinisphaera sp. T31B1 TaxID=727963 RepID=UPI00333EC7C6